MAGGGGAAAVNTASTTSSGSYRVTALHGALATHCQRRPAGFLYCADRTQGTSMLSNRHLVRREGCEAPPAPLKQRAGTKQLPALGSGGPAAKVLHHCQHCFTCRKSTTRHAICSCAVLMLQQWCAMVLKLLGPCPALSQTMCVGSASPAAFAGRLSEQDAELKAWEGLHSASSSTTPGAARKKARRPHIQCTSPQGHATAAFLCTSAPAAPPVNHWASW